MDFHATTVEGVALVCGLEWRALAGAAAADKELREYAKDIESKLYVEAKNAGSAVMCGFLPNDKKADLPRKPHSLPVVLSGVPDIAPDCVLVIEEGEYAIIAALLNGVPAPGFDGHGERDEIIAEAQAFIRLAPQGATVYGNCTALQARPLDLIEIVKTSTALKKARLHGLSASPLVRITFLAIVLLAVAGAAKYGFYYKDSLKKIAAARLANADPNVTYKNSVTRLFQAAIPAKPAMAALTEMLGPIVVSEGGWDMVGIVCQKEGCTFTWKNGSGTNKTFVVPKEVKNIKYSQKGDVISYELQFIKPFLTGLNIEKPLSIEQIWRDVIGDFQQYAALGVDRSFGNPVIYGVPSGMHGTPTNPYKEGAYSVSGPWHALGALEKLPEASTFDTVVIEISTEKTINFKLSGKYYVQ
jgi:hypothetical protein